MENFIDLTGKTFGRWTVIESSGKTKKGTPRWKVVCNCPNKTEKIVLDSDLNNGRTKSCGCLKDEIFQKRSEYRESNPRLYRIWKAMKNRCYNENGPDYKLYGGRGITVCEEWKNNFDSFCRWALENGYQEELSIDRIDVNGNYEPSNCRWATNKEQGNNKTDNVFLTYKGETKTITQWVEELKLNRNTLNHRLNDLGWTVEQAFETETRGLIKNKRVVQIDPKTFDVIETFDSLRLAAEKMGVYHSNIGNVANRKKGKHTVKGYIWRFEDDMDDIEEMKRAMKMKP